jgi:hypothetical protein
MKSAKRIVYLEVIDSERIGIRTARIAEAVGG